MHHDKVILTDVDGVLLDWATGFDNYMLGKGYQHRAGFETAYLMEDRFENITRAEGKKLIREFNESVDIGNLLPLRDAVAGVVKLASLGFRFGVITSHSDVDAACERREQCLIKLFGNVFDFFMHLETGADKVDALRPFTGSNLWWIEDKTENALVGAEAGLRSILVHHEFNSDDHHEELARVRTWSEIVDLIIE